MRWGGPAVLPAELRAAAARESSELHGRRRGRARAGDIGHKAPYALYHATKSGHTMTDAQGIIGGSVKSHVS